MATQPLVIQWASYHRQFDQPDERKKHTGQISSLGGIGWLIAIVGSLILSNTTSDVKMIHLLLPISLLFSVSLIDDFWPVPALYRLLVQFIVASWIYLMGWQLPVSASYISTVFFLLLLINAYNFIDGINGLAGTLGILACSTLAGIFLFQAQYTWASLYLAGSGGLLAFLYFNFGDQARIFFGDNGATILGLLIGVGILQIIQVDTFHPEHLISMAGAIALPVIDVIRISLERIQHGRSPFQADRKHFHHLLVDNGWSHPMSCSLVLLIKGTYLLVIPLLVSNTFQFLIIVIGLSTLYLIAQQVASATKPSTSAATERKKPQWLDKDQPLPPPVQRQQNLPV
jgi:UDP-GlcNAc:undecaprenyl-phosphate/decaprenyl-phosphate GlcNAc-1-phosphate transferase